MVCAAHPRELLQTERWCHLRNSLAGVWPLCTTNKRHCVIFPVFKSETSKRLPMFSTVYQAVNRRKWLQAGPERHSGSLPNC